MPLSVSEKMVENRVRAKAERYGLWLTRSRKRDSPIRGTYGLVSDGVTEEWAFAGPLGWGKTLEECEEYLRQVTAPAS